jgi:hypothetical protein
MESSNYLLLCASLTTLLALPAAAPAGPAQAARRSWAADNGNGTYSNPLFYDEFSDPDMIRVGADYYLTGTTMHTMPGLPILHSLQRGETLFLSLAAHRYIVVPKDAGVAAADHPGPAPDRKDGSCLTWKALDR